MKTYHVDGQLAQVSVQLTREAQAGGDTGHGGRDQVVQVTIGGGGELEGAEADVVQGLVVDAVRLIRVLDQLVDGEGGVVGLHHGVRHLWRGHHREGVHDAVRVLLTDLGDQEGSHSGSGTATKGVRQLESLAKYAVSKVALGLALAARLALDSYLEAIAGFGFLANDIENGVDEFSSFGVVTLGPVVSGSGLAEDKVVWAEDLAEGARSDGIHRARLQINQDGAWHVFAARRLVVVNVDSLQLEVRVAMVGTSRVDAVLVGDHLPELGADLVAALAGL